MSLVAAFTIVGMLAALVAWMMYCIIQDRRDPKWQEIRRLSKLYRQKRYEDHVNAIITDLQIKTGTRPSRRPETVSPPPPPKRSSSNA